MQPVEACLRGLHLAAGALHSILDIAAGDIDVHLGRLAGRVVYLAPSGCDFWGAEDVYSVRWPRGSLGEVGYQR